MKQMLLLVFLGIGTSCSSVQKMALRSSTGLFYEASDSLLSENDVKKFAQATPGNLQLMETFLAVIPGDEDLLATLTKGYSGHTLAILETQYWEAFYRGKEGQAKTDTINGYSKALSYGLKYFQEQGIEWTDLLGSMKAPGGVGGFLSDHLSSSKRDLEVALMTAQSLGGLVNIQRTDMALVSLLPFVKEMFDWVCSKDEDILSGACPIFTGAYLGGRPKMLGGEPEKAKLIFEKALRRFPYNWFIKVAYLQYYAIPQGQEDEFKAQMAELNRLDLQFEKGKKFDPFSKNETLGPSELRFFQAMAIERYRILKKVQSELF